jgi:hypothetical protein
MTTYLKPSLTRVRKLLKEAAFNPRKPGKMQIVADVGSATYYETRAQILITEAKAARLGGMEKIYKELMLDALRLLTLAIMSNETVSRKKGK